MCCSGSTEARRSPHNLTPFRSSEAAPTALAPAFELKVDPTRAEVAPHDPLVAGSVPLPVHGSAPNCDLYVFHDKGWLSYVECAVRDADAPPLRELPAPRNGRRASQAPLALASAAWPRLREAHAAAHPRPAASACRAKRNRRHAGFQDRRSVCSNPMQARAALELSALRGPHSPQLSRPARARALHRGSSAAPGAPSARHQACPTSRCLCADTCRAGIDR
jgi:hypothetical protein